MKFDPKKPCTIFNPMPQSMWPFKRGQLVYGLARGGIIRGRVHWYQPAREIDACCVVSSGNPTLNIQYAKGHSELVSVENVRKATPKGQRELEATILREYYSRVVYHESQGQTAREFFNRERLAFQKKWNRTFMLHPL